jgi:hypothetical protein
MSSLRKLATLFILGSPCAYAETVNVDDFHIDFGSRVRYGCSFVASPINFCSRKFVEAYEQAIRDRKADFNTSMIIIKIESRPRYAQQTLVAIEPTSKTVYPLPFDFLSNSFSDDKPIQKGKTTYSLQSSSLCIDGGIMAYKSVQDGHLCWNFSDGQFSGEITPYTYPER